jgi:hypothetical protein
VGSFDGPQVAASHASEEHYEPFDRQDYQEKRAKKEKWVEPEEIPLFSNVCAGQPAGEQFRFRSIQRRRSLCLTLRLCTRDFMTGHRKAGTLAESARAEDPRGATHRSVHCADGVS